MAHRGPRGSFWSDAVEWESSFDEAMVPPRARAAFAPKGGSWEDALRESVNSARDDAADAGFEWEDQLALDANAMVMRPSKFDAALGAALRRGYDTRRAVPLAEKLARADSPFHPAWPGLGRVPDAAQPRREKDWWAKEDIDPHIQRAYGRAGTSYADGAENERPTDEGVEPGDGGFLSPRRRAGDPPEGAEWTGRSIPYRTRNPFYASIPGEDEWWDLRELDQTVAMEAAGDEAMEAAANVARRRAEARAGTGRPLDQHFEGDGWFRRSPEAHRGNARDGDARDGDARDGDARDGDVRDGDARDGDGDEWSEGSSFDSELDGEWAVRGTPETTPGGAESVSAASPNVASPKTASPPPAPTPPPRPKPDPKPKKKGWFW